MVGQNRVKFDVMSDRRAGHQKGGLDHLSSRPCQSPVQGDMENISKSKIDGIKR